LELSQQELADMLRVSQSTVGMWESRRRTPKLDEINRIAGALRVTVQRLLGEKRRRIEIIKNEVYVDGKKIKELEKGDINKILEHIDLLKAAKKAAPSKTPPRVTSGARKILIIDDEQDICETLYSFLAPHNYKVFMAFNGQMGLEYFDEVKPDMVLLDLSMPDIDGIDVLKIIRKISDVPVLVITAHPEDVVDIHAGDLHIEGYIEKPFSLEKILNSIKHILEK
jgi:CheY-like chemotaxis protein/DNA-binding XRE family transcriptional regulator